MSNDPLRLEDSVRVVGVERSVPMRQIRGEGLVIEPRHTRILEEALTRFSEYDGRQVTARQLAEVLNIFGNHDPMYSPDGIPLHAGNVVASRILDMSTPTSRLFESIDLLLGIPTQARGPTKIFLILEVNNVLHLGMQLPKLGDSVPSFIYFAEIRYKNPSSAR